MPGPNPTFAQAWTQVGYLVKAFNAAYDFANANTPNFVDMHDVVVTGLDGKYLPRAEEELRKRVRKSLNDVLDPASVRAVLTPAILELADIVAAPELRSQGEGANVYDLLARIRDYMVTNSKSLNSRGMTLPNTPSSSGGTGSGTMLQLKTGDAGEPLEACWPDTRTATCIYDQNLGARRHREVFEVTVPKAEPDHLYRAGGSFKPVRLSAVDCLSAGVLRSPSFEGSSASADNTTPAAVDDIPGWVLGDTADFKLRTGASYVYRGYEGIDDDDLWGLQMVTPGALSQTIRDSFPALNFKRGGQNIPWFLQLAWAKLADATGTLQIDLGTQSTTVDISTGTNGVYQPLYIPLGTKCWYNNFQEAELAIDIACADLAVGTLLLDDVILTPFYPVGGTWMLPIGGATPFLRGKYFTFANTDGTRATLSFWLAWAFGLTDPEQLVRINGWFPTNNAGSETEVDP